MLRIDKRSEEKLADQIAFCAKPKLLLIDELGYLPLEKQTANLFFQLVSRRYEPGSILITTNQTITQWGHVFGDEVIAAASSTTATSCASRATAFTYVRRNGPGFSAQ